MTDATNSTPLKLRHAIIGVGANVYSMHKPGLMLDSTDVVGVTDIDGDAARRVAAELGCPAFPNYQVMLRETTPDICVVITPHPFHAPMSIDAMQAGCHVLVEKPMAVQVSEADAMIATAQTTGRTLAVNFQQRLRPEIIAAKALIDSGQLGQIQQADIKITWTRTALYYRMSDWRGTWSGEGGAVLMNQAPHELDLLCYLLGMPARVYAWTRTIAHSIEGEDTVQAMVEWPNGALGSIHISTAEAGQPQRFEIIASGGRLEIGHKELRFQRFDTDVLEFLRISEEAFASPKLIPQEIELQPGAGDHAAIYANLHSAILNGTPLIAPGSTGIQGLELANAMNYSSYINQPVEFPLDRQKYADLLANLRTGKALRV